MFCFKGGCHIIPHKVDSERNQETGSGLYGLRHQRVCNSLLNLIPTHAYVPSILNPCYYMVAARGYNQYNKTHGYADANYGLGIQAPARSPQNIQGKNRTIL